MSLKEPLAQLQVDAAGRLHEVLRQWRLSDAALAELHTSLPGFSETACLLKWHVGVRPKPHDYPAFLRCFNALRQEAGLQCSTRELDRYLWLTGMYRRWMRQRNKTRPPLVNAELLHALEEPTEAQKADLDRMLPAGMERVFKPSDRITPRNKKLVTGGRRL